MPIVKKLHSLEGTSERSERGFTLMKDKLAVSFTLMKRSVQWVFHSLSFGGYFIIGVY
jgi:hypothetical protein